MSHRAGAMSTFARMPMGNMGMDVGIAGNDKNLESNVYSLPTGTSSVSNPKKKRRTNAKTTRSTILQCSRVQDHGPPLLTGYGDTVVVSNPFDDTPSQMPSNPQQMLSNRNGFRPMRPTSTMNPMMNIMGPMMPQNVRNMSPMSVNQTRQILPINQSPIIRTSPMNRISQNFQNGPIMNNPMKMGQMENHRMGGPCMGNPINNIPQINQMNKFPLNNHKNNIQLGNRMNGPINMNNGPININGPINMTNEPINMNNGPINGNDRPINMTGNINSYAPTNNPLNGMNNITQNIPNPSQFNPNHMNNDIGNVRRLINANMHISHKNQMGLVEDSMGQTLRHVAPSVRQNSNMPGSLQHSGRKRSLEKPKQHSGEKIYPTDQPMIFDSQNPHAPPIYPCGICHKEVNDHDQGIVCESGCNFWFHRVCLGLSEAAFQLLTREIYAEWVCDNCLRSKDIPMVKFKP